MKQAIWIPIAIGATVPGLAIWSSGAHLSDVAAASLFGLAIIGSAFLLSWASEVAEIDIPKALAISVLAIVAVLPEYAIDVYLAWTAAYIPDNANLATANMTGANRLLIGIGWSLVVFIYWFKTRKRALSIGGGASPALAILLIATLYAFTIVLRGQLHLADTLVLGALFCLFVWTNFKSEVVEAELVGPSALIGALPTAKRRTVVLALFVIAAGTILIVAEPFVESLQETGHSLGLSEFLLIQWVAPMASEAPEMLLAAIFVLRNRGEDGIGILVSSKVNQWTLLVATLPTAYNISWIESQSVWEVVGLAMNNQQAIEVFLTAAQSLFAIVLILKLSISVRGAIALFVLFTAQLVFQLVGELFTSLAFLGSNEARFAFAVLYVALSVGILAVDRERIGTLPGIFRSVMPGGSEEAQRPSC